MDDNRFDDVLSGLPRSFNDPPPPPLDEMWAVIEDKHFNAAVSKPRWSRSLSFVPWLAAAATLLIGIGIGRYLAADASPAETTPQTIATQAAPAELQSRVVDAYRDETTQYLGQAAALLISLPAAGAPDLSDARFADKASDLLVTTRLLMDSPAAQDPRLRGLLEDLELVLVQIARLRVERNKSDLDLIHQTVEQGDVMSRLNSAVVTNQSGE
jgi:hypothetical protein